MKHLVAVAALLWGAGAAHASEGEVLAEVLVQFRGEVVTQQTIDGIEAERLLKLTDGSGCAAPLCGEAHLPKGAPAEAGFWIALADLYAQRGGVPRVRSSQRDDGSTTTQALRFLLTFKPAPGVDCAAQARFYGDSYEVNIAGEAAVKAWRRRRGLSAATVKPSVPTEGQLMLRVRKRADGAFVTEVHRGGDANERSGGEAFDQVVVCHANHALWASTLKGYKYAVAPNNGGLQVQVWRASLAKRGGAP